MSDSVLVVAAHPDDEVLGCGGTILRHVEAGDQVEILIVAEGATSRQQQRDRLSAKNELNKLTFAAEKARSILGAAGVELLDLPDNRLDSINRLDLIKQIEEKIDRHQPTIIYVHHAGDLNIDHRRLHEAVVTACRPTPGNTTRRLLSFEVASSTEWQPPGSAPAFQRIGLSIFRPMGAQATGFGGVFSEMRAWPHARSIDALEHLARWRVHR